MHKVYLYVDVNNEKAVHIYETHNFNIEGTLKEHFYTNGEYRDCYVMGLLKNQWSYSNPDNLSHIR